MSTSRPTPAVPVLTALTVAALLAVNGCPRQRETCGPRSDLHLRNVVIVLVDALRADALGCYGAPHDPTPEIDRLAEHALVFENAYSNATFTFPSTASLFTSTLPVVNRITWDKQNQEKIRRLSDHYTLLTEVFHDAGYHTGLLTFPGWVSPTANYMQGVDEWVDMERTDREIVERARSFIAASRSCPFFLYIHLVEMHDYFFPKQLFKGVDPAALGLSPRLVALKDMKPSAAYGALADRLNAPGVLTDRDIAFLKSRYIERLGDTDKVIGKLVRYLAHQGLAEDTVVAITADHGEQFMEHGRLVHGADNFYNNLLHIPFIVANPHLYDGQVRATTAISSIDMGPILLDLVGLARPRVFQGESVLDRLDDPNRVVFATDRRTWKALSRDWSYIYSKARGRDELYNLAEDPGETVNLIDERPDMVAIGRRQLAHMAELSQHHPYMNVPIDEKPMTRQQKSRLRSLGYVE